MDGKGKPVSFWVALVLGVILAVLVAGKLWKHCHDKSIYKPWQTSGSLLIKVAEQELAAATESESKKQLQKKYNLLWDIYIKAYSYAWINKLFFVLALLAGVMVVLWPSLGVIMKSRPDKWQWLGSSTVQTTVTAIAALMIAFYAQYKDQQVFAESLMRYVLNSELPANELADKVAQELSRIDKGFSFNLIAGNEDKNGSVETP